MLNFKKLPNFRIILLLVLGIIFLSNTVYATDVTERFYLRAPVGDNELYIRIGETIEEIPLEEQLSKIRARLKAPMEIDSGWLRIVALPQEAHEFHQGWTAQAGDCYKVPFGERSYILPLTIYKKMVAWSNETKDFERTGYFIAFKDNNRYNILDFIPLGSLACDPAMSQKWDESEVGQRPIFVKLIRIAIFL